MLSNFMEDKKPFTWYIWSVFLKFDRKIVAPYYLDFNIYSNEK